MKTATAFALAALAAAPAVLANARHGSNARRHQEVARRAEPGALAARDAAGVFSNAKFTWYDIEENYAQVSCEGHYKSTDFVVALNVGQYGTYWKSSLCGKQVSITYGSATAVATIVDECMGCPWGGLDFTKSLFSHFADQGDGIIYGSWHFVDGDDSGSGSAPASSAAASTSAAPAPTTTKAPAPTTTSAAYVAPSSSSTASAAPTTTSAAPAKVVKVAVAKSSSSSASEYTPTSTAAASTSEPPAPTSTSSAASSFASSSAAAAATKCAKRGSQAHAKRASAPAHVPARRRAE